MIRKSDGEINIKVGELTNREEFGRGIIGGFFERWFPVLNMDVIFKRLETGFESNIHPMFCENIYFLCSKNEVRSCLD